MIEEEKMLQPSLEQQELVLGALIKNYFLLTKIKNSITINFFTKLKYKLIYKSLIYFVDKYEKLPIKEELFVTLDDMYTPDYGDKQEIKEYLSNLYTLASIDESFIIDQTEKFIKKKKTEVILNDFLPKLQGGDADAINQMGEKLVSELSNVNINYSKAFQLSDTTKISEIKEESLGSTESPLVIKSFLPVVNSSLLYGGYKAGDLVTVVGSPGRGKSMFMINELSNAAIMGHKVLHIFLGDMTDFDGFVRYLACTCNMDQSVIINTPIDELKLLLPKCNLDGKLSRITVKAYAAGELTSDQLVQNINKIQNDMGMHYDMIAVDYPDNLIHTDEMMYLNGGDIYDKLSLLARKNKSVIITGSQPKASYWNSEILPLDSCAESSKKQQIIDVMITLGKIRSDSKLITGHIPKVRRGTVGKIFRMNTEFKKAKMMQISEQEYINLKLEEEQSSEK